MSTQTIWKKHFGNDACVGLFHENIEAFFEELNQECIQEDIESGCGWTHPTLRHVENQWRIYSNSGVAFVPLEKAIAALVAACPGAGEKLKKLDSQPF